MGTITIPILQMMKSEDQGVQEWHFIELVPYLWPALGFFPCSFCHKGCYDQCLSSSPGPSLDRALPFHPTTQLPKKYGGKKSQESQRCQGNLLSHGRHWFFCCFYNIYILKFQKLFLNPHFYEAIRYQLKQPNDRVVISINELMHSKCSQHLLHEHWLLFWEIV